MRAFLLKRGVKIDGTMFGIVMERAEGRAWLTAEDAAKRIDPGTYMCFPDDTGRHKHWYVVGEDVSREPEKWSNRSAVEWHPGNNHTDLDGCIAVGKSMGKVHGLRSIMQSGQAFEELHEDLDGEGPWLLTIQETYD